MHTDIRVCGAMRIRLTGLAVVSLLARGAGAQSLSQQPVAMTPVGIWRGTWQVRVRNDSLVGELRLSDNTKFRDVRAIRVP